MFGSLVRSPLFPSLVIAVCASVWGLYWVPLRLVTGAGIGPALSVVLFNLPALALAMLVFGWQFRTASRSLGISAVAGLFAGLGLASYALGLVLTSVIKATLLFYLTPFWSTLIAMAVLSERPGLARWSALVISLAGLALIVGIADSGLSLTFGVGEACGLASGLFWGIGAVVIRKAGDAPVEGLVVFQYLSATLFAALGLLVLTGEQISAEQLRAAIDPVVFAFSALILVSLYAIFWAMARMSPGRSGLLMMTEVIVAAVSASILLPEETLTFAEWAGAGLIIVAGLIEVASPVEVD